MSTKHPNSKIAATAYDADSEVIARIDPPGYIREGTAATVMVGGKNHGTG